VLVGKQCVVPSVRETVVVVDVGGADEASVVSLGTSVVISVLLGVGVAVVVPPQLTNGTQGMPAPVLRAVVVEVVNVVPPQLTKGIQGMPPPVLSAVVVVICALVNVVVPVPVPCVGSALAVVATLVGNVIGLAQAS
jgi:hypothetical protein